MKHVLSRRPSVVRTFEVTQKYQKWRKLEQETKKSVVLSSDYCKKRKPDWNKLMAIKGILRKLHHSQPQTEWFIKRVFTCRRLDLNKNITKRFSRWSLFPSWQYKSRRAGSQHQNCLTSHVRCRQFQLTGLFKESFLNKLPERCLSLWVLLSSNEQSRDQNSIFHWCHFFSIFSLPRCAFYTKVVKLSKKTLIQKIYCTRACPAQFLVIKKTTKFPFVQFNFRCYSMGFNTSTL